MAHMAKELRLLPDVTEHALLTVSNHPESRLQPNVTKISTWQLWTRGFSLAVMEAD
jgi:hypothetical protein